MAEENNKNIRYNSDKIIDTKKLHTRVCPYCKQQHSTQIGLNNWKNLFRKPTIEDWITLIILILLFVAAFAYITDTKMCKDTLNNLDKICLERRTLGLVNYSGFGTPVYTLPNYTLPNITQGHITNFSYINESNDSNNEEVNRINFNASG